VGRRDKLALLQDYHCDQDIKVVVISGLGGVGKSKLAFEYAMGKKHSTNCVWLRGETKETILHSLNNLALLLNIPTEDVKKMQLPVTEILSSMSSKISSTNGQPWLFVMDNVDSEHEYISTVLSSLSKQPNVFTIVTSVLRNLTNKRSTAALIELTGFTEEDSAEFISKRLGENDPELIQKLSTVLQALPLAIDQAVQYILDERRTNSLKGHAYGIEDFLAKYSHQADATDILDYKLEENEKSVFTTVKMCLERIRALENGNDTVNLLHTLSYLDPDGVPLSFLEGLIRIAEGTHEFLEKKLIVLKTFSLISFENRIITIHRVVQRIVPIIQVNAAKRLLKQLAVGTFKSLSNSNVAVFLQSEIRQTTVVWNHFNNFDNLYELLASQSTQPIRYLVGIPPTASTQDIKEIFANVAEFIDPKMDEQDFERVDVTNLIANLMKLTELETYQKTLATLPSGFSDVLFIKMKIIRSQRHLNMDVNYLEELSRLMAVAEEQLAEGHPLTLEIKYSFAIKLYDDQKYTQALDLAKEIRSFVKASDPLWFDIINLEAGCYKAQGDAFQSTKLLEERTRELEAMRKDTGPTYSNADPNGDKHKESPVVKELFPELYQLLYEGVYKIDKDNKKSESRSPDTVTEKQNSIEPGTAIRIVASVPADISAVDKVMRVTKFRFQEFFTHQPNLLNAMDILTDVQRASRGKGDAGTLLICMTQTDTMHKKDSTKLGRYDLCSVF
jgi:hypothetical protein